MRNTQGDKGNLSRRNFLAAGAAAVGGGTLASACGSDDDGDSSNSSATTGDSSSDTTTGTAGGGAAEGGTIKIGYVTPQTGELAAFGEADDFVLGQLRDLFAEGVDVGGATYTIEILDRDSESNANTAATVANELIIQEGIQMMCVAQTPDTTIPVVQACTNNEMPVLSNNAPWQPHYLGIGGVLEAETAPPVASEWNYHFFWGLEDVIEVFLAMWRDVAPANVVVGAMWPDDPDGNAWSDPIVGFPPALEAAGYTLVDPGRFPLGTTDFTAQISEFKEAGVEILTGNMIPPDFGAFWAQCQQQDFQPTAVSIGKCLLFPSAVASYPNPIGLSSEIWWSAEHPFSSSLTGQTAAELAAAYEESTGRQWTQPVGYVHSLFEVAVDALQRAGGADDKQALLDAMGQTNLATIAGQVDFNNPVVPHVTKTPLVGGQWVPSEEWDVQFDIATADQIPEMQSDVVALQPIDYA
ncbi:MAG: ABC transporter substrate-binding protein [Actinomycetota bacterium]